MNKKLAIIQSPKGGVGKTTLAQNLATYWRKHGMPCKAYELEVEQHTLSQTIEDAYSVTIDPGAISQGNSKNLDTIACDLFDDNGSVIIDVGANNQKVFNDWLQQTDLFSHCKERGVDPVILCVIEGHDAAGYEYPERLSKQLGIHVIPVLSCIMFNGNETYAKAFAEKHGRPLVIHRLYENLIEKMVTEHKSLSDIAQGAHFLERSKIQNELSKVYAQFDEFAELKVSGGTVIEQNNDPAVASVNQGHSEENSSDQHEQVKVGGTPLQDESNQFPQSESGGAEQGQGTMMDKHEIPRPYNPAPVETSGDTEYTAEELDDTSY